jgi:hypothetical protein
MSGITLTQAQAKLSLWLEAEESLAVGQEFRTDDGRTLTRANLAEVAARVSFWDRKCQRLSRATGITTQRIRLYD